MGELITRIFDALANIPPFIILDEDELGVRLRFGKYTTSLRPGLHWRIPLIHGVTSCKSKDQVVDLPSQMIGKYAVEIAIRYEVSDPRLALLECVDYDDSLMNYAMGLAGDALSGDTVHTPSELRSAVITDLRHEALKWGICVTDVKCLTFTKARAFKLFGEF